MSNHHTIVGAKWCGYSKKQAESLGCKGDGTNGPISCAAEHADATPVTFVWCQDDKGQPMNQDHPACQVKTQGYPTWTTETDGKFQANEDVKGFTDGCKVKGLDHGQLKCKERKDAMGICQTAEKAVKEHMTTEGTDGKKLQDNLEAEAKKLQEGMEEYMLKKKDDMDDLKNRMEKAKQDMQTHMQTLEKDSALPTLKKQLDDHIQNLEPVKDCKGALTAAQPDFARIQGM